jgi:serine/threonine protein kinase
VHRDLAARNVFITETNTAKIGDFGLCRMFDGSIYSARDNYLPVRWTAIEGLTNGLFTEMSDVLVVF